MLREGGRFRYLSPELTTGETENFRTTQASDVFSLAMTFFHTWTRHRPFDEIENDLQVAAAYREKRRPQRPTAPTISLLDFEEQFWMLLTRMWAQEPKSRPSGEALRKNLQILFLS